MSVSTSPPRPPTRRRRLGVIAAVSVAAVLVGGVLAAPSASAATLFSDDFADGNASGWSKSGGDWSVVSDGSLVYRQGKLDSELARVVAGSTGWTDYSVQARVKPLAFDGSARYVGIAARVAGSTKFYRLALLNTNRAELQYVNGSSVTVLGAMSRTVATGTWYTLRIDVVGSTISGHVDGTKVGSGSNGAIGSGPIGLQTFHATASFDDVLVSGSVVAPPTTGTTSPSPVPTTPTSPPPTSTSTSPPVTGLVGWATQGGGTTGGAGGATVTVTTLADLTAAAKSTTTQTIRVSGMFNCSEDVRVASNKTILGVGSNSGTNGCGFNLRDASNIIIRNLRISNVRAGNGNGDAIHLDNSSRVWIDHNDLSSNTTSGTDYYDGLLDITHGSDYVTVSWNILHDHIKCSLVGHSDSNGSEDTGHLRVTYHHNEFANCAERNPRVRFGNPVHVFNNYYVNTVAFDYSYGIATTEGAGVLVEGNYFENISDPTHIGEGSSDPGSLVARNNTLVNSGPVLTSGSVAAIPYGYTLDPSANVKSIVTRGAGVGKITT